MKKIFTRKRVIIGVLILAGVGFVGSFAFGAPVQKEFELGKAEVKDIRTIVSVVGSVKPEKETTLSFQKGGTVENVLVKEGDKVLSGQLLAELEPTAYALDLESKQAMLELEKISLQKLQNGLRPEDRATLDTSIGNAEKALAALTNTINATKAKNQSQISESELQVANARQQYEASKDATSKNVGVDVGTATSAVENAQKSLESVLRTNEENIKTSENRVREAEIALQNAKNDLTTGKPIQDKNIDNAQVKAFYEAAVFLDGVDRTLRAVNDIITIEDYNKSANGKYKELLGVKKLNSYNDLETAYSSLKANYNSKKALFVITSEVLSYQDIVSRLGALKELLDQSYSLLLQASDVLDNSITSVDFPLSQLTTLKNGVLLQKDSLATNLTGSANTKQTVESLELQKTSNVSSLSGRVSTAEGSLESAKQNLASAKVQADANTLQAKTALQQAQDNLEKVRAGTDTKNLDIDRLFNAYREAEKRLATTRATVIEQEANLDKTRSDLESQVRTAKVQRDAQAAPARSEDTRTQQERIKQAEISVQLARKALDDAKIIAPKDGVMSKISLNKGENITPGAEAMLLISEKADIIEANIAETEIASVAVGQKVNIDFDAFDQEETYEGKVTFINPDKTSLDGVIYYRIEVAFDPTARAGKDVRPGFSANLEIITDETRALSVTNTALKLDDEEKYYVEVPTIKNGVNEAEKKYVEIGMEGEEDTEVRSGLREGEEIILSVKTK